MLTTRPYAPVVLRSGLAINTIRPPFPTTAYYVAEGDSITAALASYANDLFYLIRHNNAVGGSTLANLNSRAASMDAAYPGAALFPNYVLSVLVGANDLEGYSSAAQYAADLATYCDNRLAAGWDNLAICTILPRASAPFNTRRATVNALIRTWVGSHATAVIDLAANATMGTDAAPSDTSLYYDGLHPTVGGHVALAQDAFPVIKTLCG